MTYSNAITFASLGGPSGLPLRCGKEAGEHTLARDWPGLSRRMGYSAAASPQAKDLDHGTRDLLHQSFDLDSTMLQLSACPCSVNRTVEHDHEPGRGNARQDRP
jgi:hypothetical protein